MGNETSDNLAQQNKKRDESVTVTSTKSNNDEIQSVSNIRSDIQSPIVPSKPTENTSIARVNSPKTPHQSRRKHSSLVIVNNGVTSSRICKIAARFWSNNIEKLSVMEQLEIGMSIYFSMLSANSEMKNIMKNHFNQSNQIEKVSLRYLDMMGWLIRHLIADNVDLHSQLTQLGNIHKKMGIQFQHYTPMLQSTHETFSYYFGSNYNVEVKYAIDEIFSFAAHVMTGKNFKCNAHLNDIHRQFQKGNIPFLENLNICLNSSVGKDYLYRFLSQTFCDEMVIFLQSLSRFKHLMSSKERLFVARDITKTSIDERATFCLNLSYETRVNAMGCMAEKEQRFIAKKPLEITEEFFSEVELEVYKLIMHNHWDKFVQQMKELQLKSFTTD